MTIKRVLPVFAALVVLCTFATLARADEDALLVPLSNAEAALGNPANPPAPRPQQRTAAPGGAPAQNNAAAPGATPPGATPGASAVGPSRAVKPPSAACGKPNMQLIDWTNPMPKVAPFCIDIYEYPNIAGKPPAACLIYDDAVKLCAEQGKRLCTSDEWEKACVGPSNWAFPYGPKRDTRRQTCVEGKTWKSVGPKEWAAIGKSTAYHPAQGPRTDICATLYQAQPSGSAAGCVNPDVGVYDMAGNVFEFVESPGKNGRLLGGYWVQCTNNNPSNYPGCRNCANGAHVKGFRSYEWGVRCCKNVDGAGGAAPAAKAAPGAPPAAPGAPVAAGPTPPGAGRMEPPPAGF